MGRHGPMYFHAVQCDPMWSDAVISHTLGTTGSTGDARIDPICRQAVRQTEHAGGINQWQL